MTPVITTHYLQTALEFGRLGSHFLLLELLDVIPKAPLDTDPSAPAALRDAAARAVDCAPRSVRASR